MVTETNRTDAIAPGGQGGATEGRARTSRAARPRPRPRFDKEHATLWILTVVLGLGLGAVVRIVQRGGPVGAAVQASRGGAVGTPAPGTGSVGAPLSSPNQRVLVLPQRGYSARGATRMS